MLFVLRAGLLLVKKMEARNTILEIEFSVTKYRCGVVVIWFRITETGMRFNCLSMYTSASPRQVLS